MYQLTIIPLLFLQLHLNNEIVDKPPILHNSMTVTSSPDKTIVAESNIEIAHAEGNEGGATSLRFERNKKISENKYPENSVTVFSDYKKYPPGPQRDRDLGQTFRTGAKGFKLDAIYLRVGPNPVKKNTPGARVALQFFKVSGEPKLNDRGTKGFKGVFDRVNSPELDDFIENEKFTPLKTVTGVLPARVAQKDYLKFDLTGEGEIFLDANADYAFLLMFLDPAEERTVSLYNRYFGHYQPDPANKLIGHGIRREGYPDFNDTWEERLDIQPGTDGFPDVCTYRDLYFVITSKQPAKVD